MTKRSIFQEPKIVLVFNHQGVLVAMHKSLNLASQAMNIPAQSISLCCLGYHISCYGYYFRHYEYNVVEITPHIDFGEFHVRQYDQMCSVVRRYHEPKEMNRRRVSAEKRRNNKNEDS
nr:MAG TPA: hypothetical protein [Caudoviricetes sp.]